MDLFFTKNILLISLLISACTLFGMDPEEQSQKLTGKGNRAHTRPESEQPQDEKRQKLDTEEPSKDSNALEKIAKKELTKEEIQQLLDFKYESLDGVLHLAFAYNINSILKPLYEFFQNKPNGLVEFLHLLKMKNDQGRIPLHFACLKGHDSILNELQSIIGLDNLLELLEFSDSLDHTPLYAACHNGHTSILEALHKLLKNEPDGLVKFLKLFKIKTNKGPSPLHFAVFYGHASILKSLHELVKNEPNGLVEFLELLTMEDNHGNTPLHAAFFHRHDSILRTLLELISLDNLLKLLKAKDLAGWTPLHWAFVNTPLHWAFVKGHASMLKALYEILRKEPGGLDEFLELLMMESNGGNTPLDLALKLGYASVLKQLESMKLFEAKDKDGNTIFQYALMQGHNDVLIKYIKFCINCIWNSIQSDLKNQLDAYKDKHNLQVLPQEGIDRCQDLALKVLWNKLNRLFTLKNNKNETLLDLLSKAIEDGTLKNELKDDDYEFLCELLSFFKGERCKFLKELWDERKKDEDGNGEGSGNTTGNRPAPITITANANTGTTTETTGTTGNQGAQNGNQDTQAAIDAIMASWIKVIQAQHAEIEHAERNLFNLLYANQDLPHVTLKALIEAVQAFEAMGDQELLDFHTNAYNGRNFFNTHVTALENGTEETALMIVMHNRGLFQDATQTVAAIRGTVVANFNAIAPGVLTERNYLNGRSELILRPEAIAQADWARQQNPNDFDIMNEKHSLHLLDQNLFGENDYQLINHVELINSKAEAQTNPWWRQLIARGIGCN